MKIEMACSICLENLPSPLNIDIQNKIHPFRNQSFQGWAWPSRSDFQALQPIPEFVPVPPFSEKWKAVTKW